jgi:hypothetical protein
MPKINSRGGPRINNIKRSVISGSFVLFLGAGTAQALDVYYVTQNDGGFGFAGKYRDISTLYPLAAKTAAMPAFRKALLAQVEQQTPNSYHLKINKLSNNAKNYDKSIVLDMVLDGETVSVEQYQLAGKPVYKLDVLLHAEAVFFDFAKKTILTTIPINEEYIKAFDHEPSMTDEQDVVNQAMFMNPSNNLIAHFASLIANASLPNGIVKFARVTKVTITPKAWTSISNHPEMGWKNSRIAKSFIANDFSSAMESIAGTPLEPYAIDSAAGQMAVAFSNDSVYNFKLPTPSYHIHIKLEGFKNVPYDSNAVGYSQIYGAFVHIKIIDPLVNDTYMDATFKNGVIKVIPETQVTVATGPAYQAALRGLFYKFANSLSGSEEEWIKSASSTPGLKRMLTKTNTALGSCKQ